MESASLTAALPRGAVWSRGLAESGRAQLVGAGRGGGSYVNIAITSTLRPSVGDWSIHLDVRLSTRFKDAPSPLVYTPALRRGAPLGSRGLDPSMCLHLTSVRSS